MRKKKILGKTIGTALSLLLTIGIASAGNSNLAYAGNMTSSVVLGTSAISTDGYTTKDDDMGNRKIWDGTNGQYLYLGGMKFHLLSKENNRVFLRSAACVSEAQQKKELADADLWNKLNTAEQALVQVVDLPEEEYTYGNTTYRADAQNGVRIYQMSLNEVYQYYGGLTENYQGYTRSKCKVNKYQVYVEHDFTLFQLYGALNLNLDTAAFTTPAGMEKPVSFSSTSWIRNNNSNRLTVQDGSGFQAAVEIQEVEKNSTVTVNVLNLPANNSNAYTQISAMAVDGNGAVVAYGKIGEAKSGEHSFSLPENMAEGNYTLKIFAEAVSSNTYATDYASNMAEFSLSVKASDQIRVSVVNLDDTYMEQKEKSGNSTQTVKSGEEITPIVYKVSKYLSPTLNNTSLSELGYYLPEGYLNGIEDTGLSVYIDENRETVTISGSPTKSTEIVLPTAQPQQYRGHVGELLYALGNGKIGGTTSEMIWYTDSNNPQSCSDEYTETGITDQKITVCYKPTISHPRTATTGFSLDTCHEIKTNYDSNGGTVKITVNGHETAYAEYNTDGYYRFPNFEVQPKENYQCEEITIVDNSTDTIIEQYSDGTLSGQFWMPNADVTITVKFARKTYPITVIQATGGSASASVQKAAMNTEVILTASAQDDYQLVGWNVKADGSPEGTAIIVTESKFTMPNHSVTVTPIFELTEVSKTKAAEAVRLIEGIGTVSNTDSCEAAIRAAREAYNQLTEGQKTLVSEAAVTLLEQAESAYLELKQKTEANQAAAKAAEAVIDKIGEVTYTDKCKDAIGAARAAYEELEEEQKIWVSEEKLNVLKAAERKYLELKQQSADHLTNQTMANTAIRMINAIGEVSYSDTSKAAIDAARIAYNALTADQQALIPAEQLAILTNAEAAYAALQQLAEQQKAAEEAAKRAEEEKKAAEEAAKRAEEEKKAADQAAADTAVNAITAIGTVAYSEASKAAIDAARAAYNALTDEQKALIPAEKVTALIDAEAGYTALTAAALAPKLEQKKAGKDSITISWKADQKATAGYRIYIKGGSFKKFTKAADTKKGVTSYTIKKVNKKKLTAGTQYEIKVVSLKKNGKKKAELSAQKLKAVTVTAAPKFTSAARNKSGKNITLKWKKVSGASGYEIQMSTKAKSGFKKIKTVNAKTASYTRKSLSKSKTYYFRIRTYKTVNGTKFYSSWSGVKKVNKK